MTPFIPEELLFIYYLIMVDEALGNLSLIKAEGMKRSKKKKEGRKRKLDTCLLLFQDRELRDIAAIFTHLFQHRSKPYSHRSPDVPFPPFFSS